MRLDQSGWLTAEAISQSASKIPVTRRGRINPELKHRNAQKRFQAAAARTGVLAYGLTKEGKSSGNTWRSKTTIPSPDKRPLSLH